MDAFFWKCWDSTRWFRGIWCGASAEESSSFDLEPAWKWCFFDYLGDRGHLNVLGFKQHSKPFKSRQTEARSMKNRTKTTRKLLYQVCTDEEKGAALAPPELWPIRAAGSVPLAEAT